MLHKRPDGFHELRTIFQTISLADTIDVEYQRGRTRIELKSNLNIPDNLIVQAADSVHEGRSRDGPACDSNSPSEFRWAAGWAADRATPLRYCSHCRCC